MEDDRFEELFEYLAILKCLEVSESPSNEQTALEMSDTLSEMEQFLRQAISLTARIAAQIVMRNESKITPEESVELSGHLLKQISNYTICKIAGDKIGEFEKTRAEKHRKMDLGSACNSFS